jgi:hypothetical protein
MAAGELKTNARVVENLPDVGPGRGAAREDPRLTHGGRMKRTALLVAMATCLLVSHEALAEGATAGNPDVGLGLKSLGIAIGYVSPEDVDGTFSIGVFADHGRITPNIAVESRLDYWSHSESEFGADASISDITLGARGKYFFEVSHPNLRPFAGAGLGLHFLHAEVTIPAMGGNPEMKVEDSTTKLGLDLGGGIATSINPRMDFLGELWYGIVSDASQFSLRAGLSYRLGS